MNIVQEINDFYYYMALNELQTMNGEDVYHGLSYNSILYINVISLTENCTVSRIAEILKITKSAATLKVNDLVSQGVIVKKQSQNDKRVYYLTLSPEMEEVMGTYDSVFLKIEERLKEKYTEEELRLFGEILRTICGFEWRKMKHET